MYNGKLTLHNDFHNTDATVIVNNGIISSAAMKRAEKKLCGMRDCSCGGLRGPQDMVIDEIHSAQRAHKIGAKVGDFEVSEK